MDGRIPRNANGDAPGDASDRVAVSHALIALAAAFGGGAIALVSPPAALLILACLATRALMRAEDAPRFDLIVFVGPALAACVVGAFAGLAGAVGVLFVWRLQGDVRWSLGEARRLAL